MLRFKFNSKAVIRRVRSRNVPVLISLNCTCVCWFMFQVANRMGTWSDLHPGILLRQIHFNQKPYSTMPGSMIRISETQENPPPRRDATDRRHSNAADTSLPDTSHVRQASNHATHITTCVMRNCSYFLNTDEVLQSAQLFNICRKYCIFRFNERPWGISLQT